MELSITGGFYRDPYPIDPVLTKARERFHQFRLTPGVDGVISVVRHIEQVVGGRRVRSTTVDAR